MNILWLRESRVTTVPQCERAEEMTLAHSSGGKGRVLNRGPMQAGAFDQRNMEARQQRPASIAT